VRRHPAPLLHPIRRRTALRRAVPCRIRCDITFSLRRPAVGGRAGKIGHISARRQSLGVDEICHVYVAYAGFVVVCRFTCACVCVCVCVFTMLAWSRPPCRDGGGINCHGRPGTSADVAEGPRDAEYKPNEHRERVKGHGTSERRVTMVTSSLYTGGLAFSAKHSACRLSYQAYNPNHNHI